LLYDALIEYTTPEEISKAASLFLENRILASEREALRLAGPKLLAEASARLERLLCVPVDPKLALSTVPLVLETSSTIDEDDLDLELPALPDPVDLLF
jgi:hypothetical protein